MKPVLPLFTAILLTQAALAAETGFYLQATGGYTMPNGNVELQDLETDQGSTPNLDLSADDGWMSAVALGYDWGPFRVEAEGSYRRNGFGEASDGWVGSADGDFQASSLMGNAIFELPIGERAAIYFGAGIGVASVHVDTNYTTMAGPMLPAFRSGSVDVETGASAYQGLAGIEFNLSQHLTLNVGYRAWTCWNTEFDDNFNQNSSENLEGNLSVPVVHQVEVGLRYTL
jgi:opacity protein-like surface antigen